MSPHFKTISTHSKFRSRRKKAPAALGASCPPGTGLSPLSSSYTKEAINPPESAALPWSPDSGEKLYAKIQSMKRS